jgi:hypothetical protein
VTGADEPIVVRLPRAALTRLDDLGAAEGATRAAVARRLLLDALADPDSRPIARAEAYSLLDIDEDLASP